MTHICVSNVSIICSDSGLSSGRCRAIIWTSEGISLIGPLGTNLSQILIEIDIFSFKKMRLKMWSGKWRSLCIGFNVLKTMGCDYSSIFNHTIWMSNYVPPKSVDVINYPLISVSNMGLKKRWKINRITRLVVSNFYMGVADMKALNRFHCNLKYSQADR